MAIPGINRTSACAILIELGPDITVFTSRRHLAAWAGLCPGNNEGAGKRRSGRTRRCNTTLREVLIECAQGATRTRNCQFRGYHKALACGEDTARPPWPPLTS
ncbi:MAG: IS110 family transposase [bacterium]|nr:IS110 family transposase [bacterium]